MTFLMMYVKLFIAPSTEVFFLRGHGTHPLSLFGIPDKEGMSHFDKQGLEVLGMRVKIVMACMDCKQRNYNTMKNKKNDPDRIEIKKYCKFCHKHTSHKETK